MSAGKSFVVCWSKWNSKEMVGRFSTKITSLFAKMRRFNFGSIGSPLPNDFPLPFFRCSWKNVPFFDESYDAIITGNKINQLNSMQWWNSRFTSRNTGLIEFAPLFLISVKCMFDMSLILDRSIKSVKLQSQSAFRPKVVFSLAKSIRIESTETIWFHCIPCENNWYNFRSAYQSNVFFYNRMMEC